MFGKQLNYCWSRLFFIPGATYHHIRNNKRIRSTQLQERTHHGALPDMCSPWIWEYSEGSQYPPDYNYPDDEIQKQPMNREKWQHTIQS